MNRRSFIAALAALAATPRALLSLRPAVNPNRLPVLWADGIHDDGPALQAFCDGFRVWDANARCEVGFDITGRTLYLKRTVYIGLDDRPRGSRHGVNKSIRDCFLKCDEPFCFDSRPRLDNLRLSA